MDSPSSSNTNAELLLHPHRPIPVMPSPLFQELAHSQLEFLANALPSSQQPQQHGSVSSKVKTMALYLPQENAVTGQLEFTPAIVYPRRDRVFIAADAASGLAPTLPPTLTKLPGFAHAKALIPGYPMVTSSSSSSSLQEEDRNDKDDYASSSYDGTVGVVEEVLCDWQSLGACALSVPLFKGLQTLGVLLVSPADRPATPDQSVWTSKDRNQVARAAQSLSIALAMDQEKQYMVNENQQIAQALSDSMHQVKNPLQALRTYGKLLQREIAKDPKDHDDPEFGDGRGRERIRLASSQQRLVELADHLMVQSDRLVQRLKPMDSVVERLTATKRPSLLLPASDQQQRLLSLPSSSLAQWPTPLVPWEEEPKNNGFAAADGDTQDWQEQTLSNQDSVATTPLSLSSLSESSELSPTHALLDLELEMAFVPDVLEPILDAFAAIAEDSGIHFSVTNDSDDLPGVHIHPQSLQEVVSNLLDNAFKYVVLGRDAEDEMTTPPQVGVCLLPNEDAQRWNTHRNEPVDDVGVTILVTDNGPGIPNTAASEIFERGYRIPTTAAQTEGQGFGLAIAQSLVHAMGGEIRVVDNNTLSKRARHFRRTCHFDPLPGATMEVILYRNPKR